MQLRLVTYNIHRAIGTDRRFRPERIVSVVDSLDADILLLQEVDEGVPRSRELDLAAELAAMLGFQHYAVGHNVSLKKGRYGNATLSRFPIERERNIDLTVGRLKRRGCQHTTIHIGRPRRRPFRLEVFNLHLGLSAIERERQMGLLAHSPELKGLSRRTACLIAGDFNDWRSLLRAFLVQGLHFRCATDRQRKNGTVRALTTYPAFAPQGALDRIYYRGGLRLKAVKRVTTKGARVASDHLPVQADFDLG